ncbi:hypothetical protein A4H97_09205 [Niastella yeongjuensis]|uniref:Ig-like domain-containing protein n=1 Tax=Niastella yeongjuensis TaxID=354355 RepID=A0A1V9EEI1_9BACT|nr:hypothetical protein [Niastella yeongjuensis]OQP44539.1 hypothetical protein A4H97_09205 [Niastella yeongjuensis]SEO84185.1 Por secretion system C-terminal sorting domain-containing protein [Niastella yeongjuensis]
MRYSVPGICLCLSLLFSHVIYSQCPTANPSQTLTPPTCPGGNDGKILVTVTNGKAPFTYALISPSPITVPPQSGNEFTGLIAGSYTYQVTDACGNFQTRTVTLADGNNGSFGVNMGNLQYEGCDSFSIPYKVAAGILRPPYTSTITLPNGVKQTHVFNSSDLLPPGSGYALLDTFRFKYHHAPNTFEDIIFDMTNGCNYAINFTAGLAFYLNMRAVTSIQGCSNSLTYTFDQNVDNSPGSTYQVHCNTITYKLISPANVLLATQVNNSTFSGFPPGNNYRIVREDCCGKDSIYFRWEPRPALDLYATTFTANGKSCKEGAAGISVSLLSPMTQVDLILASGPPSITFGDGTVHNYTYPDTLKKVAFSVNNNLTLNYFTAGTYTLVAVDTCGNRDTVVITMPSSALRHSTLTTTLKKGCVNDNKIIFTAQSNSSGSDGNIRIADQFWNAFGFPLTDSVVNLPPGTYNASYTFSKQGSPFYYFKGMSSYSCDILQSTIVIPAYTQPTFAAVPPAIAVCSNLRNIALLPDSNTGVSPYTYRISAGAATTPFQSSNVFTGLTAGSYTLQLADACNNSSSKVVAIDTLSVPPVNVAGTVCTGSNTILSLPSSPYYTYSWQRPNGSIENSNTLTLNPLTTNDLGTYIVSATSNINGCANTKTHQLVVKNCSIAVLPMTLLQFNGNRRGNTVVLQWRTADEINTSHFMVERSTDGVHFTAIQKVMVSGESTGNYTATDYQPLPGLLFYRLEMVDRDGKGTYSATLSINNDNNIITVTPRLINDNSELKVTHTASTQGAVIQITSLDGRVWLTQPVAKGSLQTAINTNGLSKGNYLVVYSGNGTRTAVHVVKL